MFAELGHVALVLALSVAIIQVFVPLYGSYTQDNALMNLAKRSVWLQWALLVIAFLALTYAFLQNDFSFDYVVRQSNTQLPTIYKVAAVWGGHEGSLLLWSLVLASWSVAVAIFSRGLALVTVARVLSVLGAISVAFLLFILLTSNPFARLLPDFPPDGRDLNPVLQDPGLIIHPPMLYMGYVGFAVPFAFVMAGLLGGRLDSAWARWLRPWTLAAWCFLTLGIALGSWWAYYELGWGGWWFWDPVENASFMPWLAGTALLHSLAVTKKRGVFKTWTVLLAIITFALSLLGTFLVRSGVLTSVHSFAADPARGLFVLGILAVVIGIALILFAWRAPLLANESRYNWLSKEMFILINNLLLLAATTTVLLGTLFPLIADAFNWGKISVGPPYFNLLFVPLSFILLVFLIVGPNSYWKKNGNGLFQPLLKILPAALLLGIVFPLCYFGELYTRVVVANVLVLAVLLAIILDIKKKTQHQGFFLGLRKLSRSYWGMQFAHIGLLVMVIGVAFTSHYSVERDVRMGPEDSVTVGAYTFVFQGVDARDMQNYHAIRAFVQVQKDKKVVATLHPEKRRYFAQKNVTTEAAIQPGLFLDLYVALGEPLGKTEKGDAWAVRIYYKPFVRWIWLGSILMAIGGVCAASDKRYRFKTSKA